MIATPMICQRTLADSVHISGIGLHSGKMARLTLSPAAANTGIRFFRDIDADAPAVPALATHVVKTTYATTLGIGDCSFMTVEHLLSALYGLGIDNVRIVLDGEEVPIMDGSAAPFIYALEQVGVCEQAAPKRFICVRQTVRVGDDHCWAQLLPFAGFRISFTIDYGHPAIAATVGSAVIDFSAGVHVFTEQIAYARTFGFMRDFDHFRANNLALGGSTANAVILDDDRILNAEGARCEAEFVKHKILDAVGDLSLVGGALVGHYTGHKAGHRLNNALVRALLADADNYRVVHYQQADTPIRYDKGSNRLTHHG